MFCLSPSLPSLSKHTSVVPSQAPAYSWSRNSVRAQRVAMKAWRHVDVPFKQPAAGGAAEEYMKEVDRVVKIVFPDSARISYIGDGVWRARLKSISFFHISATPVCDLRVCHENNALKLESNKLLLDFLGLQDQFKHLDFDFLLLGKLIVAESSINTLNRSFQGWVKLALTVDMPLPFSLIPTEILAPVGNNILDQILGAMKAALLAGIIQDYKQWCTLQESKQSLSASNVVLRGRG